MLDEINQNSPTASEGKDFASELTAIDQNNQQGNVDENTLIDDEEPTKASKHFFEIHGEHMSNLNQTNIGAAIAGVVGGGAIKLQALQKWLKGNSFDEAESPKSKKSDDEKGRRDSCSSRSDAKGTPKSIDMTFQFDTEPKESKSPNGSFFFSDPSAAFSAFNNKSLKIESKEIPKRALSPSIAETLRAVFAAFLWHEGLVHDAMACASFLKFHPNISKKESENMPVGTVGDPVGILTHEQKVQQRHSVEFSNAGKYLNIRPSTLETLAKIGNCCVHNRKLRNRNVSVKKKCFIFQLETCFYTFCFLFLTKFSSFCYFLRFISIRNIFYPKGCSLRDIRRPAKSIL